MKFIFSFLLMLLAAPAANAQSTITAQIHNACGWQASTTYTYSSGPPTAPFKRVNNGAGWTPTNTGVECGTGTYTAAAALNNYQLRDPGGGHTCVSAASGGPSGTSSGITDGTCTWDYVGPVDYVTMTGWGQDTTHVWTNGLTVGFLDVVETNDANLPTYQQQTAGCTSTVKPTGNLFVGQFDGTLLADGCVWRGPMANVTYTSRAKTFPMAKFYYDSFQGTVSGNTLTVTTPPATWPVVVNQSINYNGISPAQLNPSATSIKISASCGANCWTLSASTTAYTGTIYNSIEGSTCTSCTDGGQWGANDFYVASLWNDRVYLAGSNGEGNPISTYNHNFEYNDAYHFFEVTVPANCAPFGGYGCPIAVTAAGGESFQDTLAANPSVALAGANANNGVMIHNTAGFGAEGLVYADNVVETSRLQVKADGGPASPIFQRACNFCYLHHNIMEGLGDGGGIVSFGAVAQVNNNLLIAHNGMGVQFDYGGMLYNNTIVCPEGPTVCTASAVANSRDWQNPNGVILKGNAMFGFAHLIAGWAVPPNLLLTNSTNCSASARVDDCLTWYGSNNATDVVSTDGNDYPNTTFTAGEPYYVQNFQTGALECSRWTSITGNWGSYSTPIIPETCGVLNSLSASAVFVTWPGNYRIANTSALYGAGANFGTDNHSSPVFLGITPSTPDILGTTRPQGGRYDIGAFELLGGGSAAFGGRFLFR